MVGEGREEMSTQLLWLPHRGSSNGTWRSRPLLHAASGGGREWALTAGRKRWQGGSEGCRGEVAGMHGGGVKMAWWGMGHKLRGVNPFANEEREEERMQGYHREGVGSRECHAIGHDFSF